VGIKFGLDALAGVMKSFFSRSFVSVLRLVSSSVLMSPLFLNFTELNRLMIRLLFLLLPVSSSGSLMTH
jgi:hypothetical protein